MLLSLSNMCLQREKSAPIPLKVWRPFCTEQKIIFLISKRHSFSGPNKYFTLQYSTNISTTSRPGSTIEKLFPCVNSKIKWIIINSPSCHNHISAYSKQKLQSVSFKITSLPSSEHKFVLNISCRFINWSKTERTILM